MPDSPTVWAVTGDKAGDNAQLAAVTARLGFRVEHKLLRFKPRYVTGKPLFRASLHHVDRRRSAPLGPPWPELVLTIGRRPAMAALWIKKQSGGATRVALFGRPKRRLDVFDLIVAPVQYGLPPADNLLCIGLPLMRMDEQRITAAAERWRAELAGLPRPLVAVLVGGTTKPYVLDAAAVVRLVAAAREYVDAQGSLFVSTSRRTPAAAIDALRATLPANARLFEWRPGAESNPYQALLGLADAFIVTGDSISMLTEVTRLQRPLRIFPLPERRAALTRLAGRLLGGSDWAHPSPLQRLLLRLGLASFPRRLPAIHDWLYARGLAAPVGVPLGRTQARADDDLDRVVARIRALVARGESAPGAAADPPRHA